MAHFKIGRLSCMTCVILLLPQGSIKMEGGRRNRESGGSEMKNKRPREMPLFLTLKMSKWNRNQET